MSRLVMNMIQIEYGLIPSIEKKESRNEYISSLAKAQDEEKPKVFIDFMIGHHKSNIENSIAKYKASIENDTLNLENDTLKLSDKERMVLEIIKDNPDFVIMGIVEKTGFSRPTVMSMIKSLKEKHILE